MVGVGIAEFKVSSYVFKDDRCLARTDWLVGRLADKTSCLTSAISASISWIVLLIKINIKRDNWNIKYE